MAQAILLALRAGAAGRAHQKGQLTAGEGQAYALQGLHLTGALAEEFHDIDGLEEAAKRGDLLPLPRMGQKFTDKLLKGIEDHRRNASRFRIDVAREHAERIAQAIRIEIGV